MASRLTACLREGDIVARLGVDEYVIIFENLGQDAIASAEKTTMISQEVLIALNRPYQLNTGTYQSTASIGIALFSDH